MNNKPFIINVETPQSDAKNNIFTTYDYNVSASLYEKLNDNRVPIIYNLVYKFISSIDTNDKIITIYSPDHAITASAIGGIAERYKNKQSNGDNISFTSNLRTIYFTPRPHMSKLNKVINIESLTNSVMTNVLCNNKTSFTGQQLRLSPKDFIMIGINKEQINDLEMEELNNSDVVYFDTKKIKKIGWKKVFSFINNTFQNSPICAVIDLSVLNYSIAPCTVRFMKTDLVAKNESLLNLDDYDYILRELAKMNVVGLVVTGYDFRVQENEPAYRVTCETARLPLKHIFDMKEKTINIFNENSKFLIWRPVKQASESDIGWFILRNIDLDTREALLKSFDLDENIRLISVDDDDVLVTNTTIEDQNQKSYYMQKSIYDCVLFPEEKAQMMFELLNTNENSLLMDK